MLNLPRRQANQTIKTESMNTTKIVTQKQKLEELYGNLETAERFELLKESIKILDKNIEDFTSMKTLNEPQQAMLVSLLDRKKIREEKLKTAKIESAKGVRRQIDELINSN